NQIITLLLMLTLSVYTYSGVLDSDPRNKIEIKVKDLLLEKGFEQRMIHDLFGDEFFYFPKTDEGLDLSYYIVDKIIKNGQYSSSDREQLRKLAMEAYELFKQDISETRPKDAD
ncbi:MAG: hypothetical protein ACO2Z9_11435, partial [Crocinitomicaceae bacterium]